ncbi:MAG: hypothetical protein MAG715_00438 [Methanonatronarchaeales archaeon]|nr:hypothetical protein [Methanonatronarchaeales archaeon]
MRLGILLARDPVTYHDAHTALHVAEAGLERGDEVEVFLLDEAVYLADSAGDEAVHVKVQSLMERGLRVVLCHHNASERGMEDRVLEGVEVESVIENGRMARESDRYLSFT